MNDVYRLTLVDVVAILVIPVSVVLCGLGVRLILARLRERKKERIAQAIMRAWIESAPPPKDTPGLSSITWDESKMTEEQKLMLLPKYNRPKL